MQSANETQFGTWGCLLAVATVTLHAAGWLEGGRTLSYEKLITDVEVLQMMAETCITTAATEADIALDALAEVEPGGNFFGATHTMERYQTEFYEPLVADFSNIARWEDRGSIDATTRATGIWQGILRDIVPPAGSGGRLEALSSYISSRTATGGCAPES